MKYIKNLFVIALSAVILLAFTACSDKKTESTQTAKIEVSSDKKTKELIDDILEENNKDKNASKDKYKSKLSDSTPKNPKIGDYDFKKGVSSTESNDTNSDNNSSNTGCSGSGYDEIGSYGNSGYGNSSYAGSQNNSSAEYQDLVNYVKKAGTRDNGLYSITQSYNKDDKSTMSLIYDEKLQNCYVELMLVDKSSYTKYQLDVPDGKKKTRFIVTPSDKKVSYLQTIDETTYNRNTKIQFTNNGLSKEENDELSKTSTQNCFMMVSFLASQISKSGTGYTINDYGFTNL